MEKSGQEKSDEAENSGAVGNQRPDGETKPVSTGDNVPQLSINYPESYNKNTSSTNNDTGNQNSSSLPEAQMEVHHHPNVEHKSKPFKEYLLEGFMIFIAVMMGFIAENIRENFTAKEHVRELTRQLVQDLTADTATLNKICADETQILKSNDTLLDLLQKPLAQVDIRRMQKLIADSHSMWPFHPSAGAITAIKNELHLKQFSNSAIISYIAKYEGHIDLLHTIEGITLQYQRAYLDPFLTQHFTPANLQASFTNVSSLDAHMRNITQEDLTQLGVDMVLIRINTRELVDDNRLLVRNDAVNLLQYVSKQFDVKDK